jgi:intraflagellar transport protein 140
LQAGERTKAMKALLHTHERDKIIRFATACRDPAVYLMAAQFLQTSGDWMNDGDALAKITQFYSKAKSPLHTARFYETCAQVKIEESQDYEGACQDLQVLHPTSICTTSKVQCLHPH